MSANLFRALGEIEQQIAEATRTALALRQELVRQHAQASLAAYRPAALGPTIGAEAIAKATAAVRAATEVGVWFNARVAMAAVGLAFPGRSKVAAKHLWHAARDAAGPTLERTGQNYRWVA